MIHAGKTFHLVTQGDENPKLLEDIDSLFPSIHKITEYDSTDKERNLIFNNRSLGIPVLLTAKDMTDLPPKCYYLQCDLIILTSGNAEIYKKIFDSVGIEPEGMLTGIVLIDVYSGTVHVLDQYMEP